MRLYASVIQWTAAAALFAFGALVALSFEHLGVTSFSEAAALAREAVFGKSKAIFLSCAFEGARFGDPDDPSLRTNRSRCMPLPSEVDRNLELMANFNDKSTVRELSRSVARVDLLYCGADQDQLACDTDKEIAASTIWQCTGVLVDPTTILTALHCIPESFVKAGGGFKAQLWFGYFEDIGVSESVVRPFGVTIEPQILDHGAKAFLRGEKETQILDYALLTLPSDAAAKIAAQGYLPASFSVAPLENGQDLLVVHHPLGDAQHLSRRGCRVRSEGADDISGLVGHSCGSFPGTSGAPIFDERTRAVVAIHVLGDPSVVRLESNEGFGLTATKIASDLKTENAGVAQALRGPPVAFDESN